ncbi:MAG: tRNA lysidine(34) synthetase TilS [Pseudomonadota bacterium]
MSSHDRQHPLGALQHFLQARRQDAPAISALVIALSGGPDSLALLLAAAQIAPPLGYRLRALHVHHGLNADADAWAAQAVKQAAAVGISCDVLRVKVPAQASIEAAARQVRYDALAQAMTADEALLLAHHQDDQAETMLLRLMRGAGLNGLTAMPATSVWPAPSSARIQRWRPWLALPRSALERWLPRATACCLSHAPELSATALQPVHDPANHDARFDRTLLRAQVLPLLQTRWPEAASQLARSAAQLAQQARALDALADAWLAQHSSACTLALLPLQALDDATLQAVLSRWLTTQGMPPLPVLYWPRLRRELLHARADAAPEIRWADAFLRRYRQTLYLLWEADLPSAGVTADWPDPRQPLQVADRYFPALPLPDDNSLLARCWRLAPRTGGERWQPAGRAHHVTLKHWCQEQGIPPWQRQALTCVWAGDEVVMVVSADGRRYAGNALPESCCR